MVPINRADFKLCIATVHRPQAVRAPPSDILGLTLWEIVSAIVDGRLFEVDDPLSCLSTQQRYPE